LEEIPPIEASRRSPKAITTDSRITDDDDGRVATFILPEE